jgi:hypothetical protein
MVFPAGEFFLRQAAGLATLARQSGEMKLSTERPATRLTRTY